jgi:hypothetical protein
MSRYTRTPRLEAAARECGGFNEATYRSIPDWEQELWCSRAWAAIETYAIGCACGRTDQHGPHED